MKKDPVCGQEVNPENTRFESQYGVEHYYFCSAECKRQFDDHPDERLKEFRAREGKSTPSELDL